MSDGNESPYIEPWQGSLSKKLGFRSRLLFWVIVGFSVFVIQLLIIILKNGSTNGLLVFGIYCAVISYGGFLPTVYSNKMVKLYPSLLNSVSMDNTAFYNWYKRKLSSIFSIRGNIIAFVIFGPPLTASLLLGTDTFQLRTPWFEDRTAEVYAIFAFVFFAFIVVNQANFIYHISIFVRQFSKLPLQIPIYLNPENSIKALGRFMFFVSITTFIGLTALYVGMWLSPIPQSWLILGWIPISSILVLALFLIPQYGIHQIMIDAKNKRLSEFSKHYEILISKTISEPTERNIDELVKYAQIKGILEQTEVWPFDSKTVFQLLSAVLVPLLLTVLQKLIE